MLVSPHIWLSSTEFSSVSEARGTLDLTHLMKNWFHSFLRSTNLNLTRNTESSVSFFFFFFKYFVDGISTDVLVLNNVLQSTSCAYTIFLWLVMAYYCSMSDNLCILFFQLLRLVLLLTQNLNIIPPLVKNIHNCYDKAFCIFSYTQNRMYKTWMQNLCIHRLLWPRPMCIWVRGGYIIIYLHLITFITKIVFGTYTNRTYTTHVHRCYTWLHYTHGHHIS